MGAQKLALFDPDQPEEPAGKTLQECWEEYVLPHMGRGQRAAATIAADQTALNHWSTRTTSPRAHQITDQTLILFRDAMLDGVPEKDLKPLGTRTVMKTWASIRKILRRIGPRETRNPQGAGLITTVPYLPPLHHRKTRPRIVELPDVSRAYEACRVAKWPHIKGLPAPLFWRVALVVWYFYGLRTQDLTAYTRTAGGLKWAEVSFDARSPDPESEVVNPSGWLDFLPDKTARTRGENLILPLHPVARAHLDAIHGDRPRVLPCAYCSRSFYRQWAAIQRAAKIDRPFSPGDLRKTCNNMWHRTGRGGLGLWVLGHAPRGTNAQFYTQVEPELLAALPLLPVPDAFRSDLPGRQLILF